MENNKEVSWSKAINNKLNRTNVSIKKNGARNVETKTSSIKKTFYQRMIERNNKIKLIVTDDYLQILNSKKIYLQAKIDMMNIHTLHCGTSFNSAIKISNEESEGIIIGVKKRKNIFQPSTMSQLKQPDYWLQKTNQWEMLSLLLMKE